MPDRRDAERFGQEVAMLGRVRHPNVVKLLDHGKAGRYHYLVLEWVEGRSLREVIAQARRAGKLPDFADALRWFEQVAKGLAAIHAVGMVHRDIKPSNILLEPDGVARVADLGIAKRIDAGHTSYTTTGHVSGTFEYMAPEQLSAPDTVDGRADLYALGVTFYELLTGTRPVGPWRPATTMNPTVLKGFDTILSRLLEPQPEHRYRDIYELLSDLSAIQRPEPQSVVPLAAPPVHEKAIVTLQPQGNNPIFKLIGYIIGGVICFSIQSQYASFNRPNRTRAVVADHQQHLNPVKKQTDEQTLHPRAEARPAGPSFAGPIDSPHGPYTLEMANEKLELARMKVAELIVAAQEGGHVRTTIDPPPILDLLITGKATDEDNLKAVVGTDVTVGVSPEVYGAWFCGYGRMPGITHKNIRIVSYRNGLSEYYRERSAILSHYLASISDAGAAASRADILGDTPLKKERDAAWLAVAEAVVAARKASLVDTSIDPPPILDLLITGRADEAPAIRAAAQNAKARKVGEPTPEVGVGVEVFGAWFCGNGRINGISGDRPKS